VDLERPVAGRSRLVLGDRGGQRGTRAANRGEHDPHRARRVAARRGEAAVAATAFAATAVAATVAAATAAARGAVSCAR
jgi:hypothetical protein